MNYNNELNHPNHTLKEPIRSNDNSFFTKHARERMQQRGISEIQIEWLDRFGKAIPDHHGAEKYIFDKRSKKRLKSIMTRAMFRAVESFIDGIYMIKANGQIITCGHITKHIKQH